MDCIANISTPYGTGAISIVRMSGQDCLKIALNFFLSKNEKGEFLTNKNIIPRYMYLGELKGEHFREQCLMVYFKGPKSFTGEDMVEFQIHGGEFLTEEVLNECLKHGARLSENGEFSKRAFLNGKFSLDQAEGIIDIIEATSRAEIKAGFELLNGELFKKIEIMQNSLTEILAKLEVTIDYPEYDDEKTELNEAKEVVQQVENNIFELLKNSEHGQVIKSGINVAIVGKPNVGKSSLLNAVLGSERAIVTDVAGTTRDTIKETILYNGVKINFIDTAGLRESGDKVEKIGIERTKETIKQSDIVVFLIDASEELNEEDFSIYKKIQELNPIVVLNKKDIKKIKKIPIIPNIEISSKTKEGISELIEEIYRRTIVEKIDSSTMILTNKRHIEALKEAKKQAEKTIKILDEASVDIAVFEIKKIWSLLGKITGVSENEKIIDEIFSRFCLGK